MYILNKTRFYKDSLVIIQTENICLTFQWNSNRQPHLSRLGSHRPWRLQSTYPKIVLVPNNSDSAI